MAVMGRAIATGVLMMLLIAMPSQAHPRQWRLTYIGADDAQAVKVHLREGGVDRIRSVRCQPDRHCVARYAYINQGWRTMALRRLGIERCHARFIVSEGRARVPLPGGPIADYVQVDQFGERCNSAARYSRG